MAILSLQLATLTAVLLATTVAGQDQSLEYKIPDVVEQSGPPVHLGCFREVRRGAALAPTTGPQTTSSRTMSPAACEAFCKQNFPKCTVFGMSRGTDCYCGSELTAGMSTGVPLTECDQACVGDSSRFCGATLRLNVYGPSRMLTAAKIPSNSIAQGCYKNAGGGRKGYGERYPVMDNNKMTIPMCRDHCSLYQTKYFGVEAGRYCNCGDTLLDSLVKVDDTQCKTPCRGDKGAFCGATNMFNHYELDSSSFKSIGQWSPLVQFPVIPVAVALIPKTGDLLAWTSGWPNRWTFSGNGETYTSTYSVTTGNVSRAIIEDTKHDMFCPGITMDVEGRIIVTGGSTAAKTSIFDPATGRWSAAANMKIARGYQSSCLTSEGKVFTIGGSFTGAGRRDGEVYDPKANQWSKLPGCPVKPLVMDRGLFPDSHAWLFGWKNGYVLQAGPSRMMNWFDTKGSGATIQAGTRGQDADSMCGVFVMYDAVAGKVLTLGGGPAYDGVDSTSNAHILTIREAGEPVAVEKIVNSHYNRGFANGVVLPDGTVFIVGGQSRMRMFSDSNPQLFPEIWDPKTKEFRVLRAHTIARNYHSTAILMPDATVFSGGGGLCGAGCTANHFDGQFFSPPYLFLEDGQTPAPRPKITGLSTSVVKVGGSITISMDRAATYRFSMIRTGTATHAVNTDQRRIKLESTGAANDTEYSITVPDDAGIAIPGYWMLFVISEAGVPSVAEFFKVTL